MNIIQPREIAAKIMTLIELADEKVILISPYIQVEKWPQMKKTIKKALERGVEIEFYTRVGEAKSIYEIRQLGLEPFLIEDLHAKIYMNEQRGIITSQNLYLYSDINSLDIGVEVDGSDFLELQDYYQNYVLRYKKNVEAKNEILISVEDKELLKTNNIYEMICMLIDEKFGNWQIGYYDQNYIYKFKVGRRSFELSYDFTDGETYLNFNSILTQDIYHYLKPREKELKTIVGNDLDINDPGEGYYQSISYFCKLPERKLKYCNEQQIISLAKKISAAFIVPMDIVRNSGVEKITKYL